MANVVPGEDAQLSFPLPPLHFYQHYTNENVKNDLAPKPPKVVVGEYSMYGHIFKTDDQIIQPLESQGIMRLYSKEEDFDHIVEMKKLNHSILVNYLELVDIMIYAPASPERQKKIEEIKVLFINLHHLINEFRPHQARETLRVLLHRQKQQTLETADRLRRVYQKDQQKKIFRSQELMAEKFEKTDFFENKCLLHQCWINIIGLGYVYVKSIEKLGNTIKLTKMALSRKSCKKAFFFYKTNKKF
ncbi:mediator of RNA polymerase II transcription subunit 7 isoform X1 [Hydra vulgaris]|uniref:mediator of RNA polymerase II transcription subunit 7 isoform X1 n=1 Tax=Hydra vulgaris TaxID=6087 RepID=UPI001F5F9504|nr:mediator of RNA polymerase II transcription subunit 7 isoform X2 [Hydra vulgaris]